MRLRGGAFALLLALAATARADEPAPDPEDPPPQVGHEVIVVVGLRLPRAVRDVPAAVTVVRRDELERSPQVLADELLRTLPSVGTFRRSSSLVADPTSQGLSLRGVGSSAVSRALVLRDGVPLNDPFGGWMYWRALSPLGIDHIEVVPSGASALFGDFALGGVVNVVSRPIEPGRLEAVVAGGSLGTGRAAVRATDRRGDLGVALDAEVFHSDGYAPIAPAQRGPVDGPASSDHGAAGARVEHRRGGSTSHVTARWFQEALDAGTAHTTADVRVVTVGAGWRLAGDASTLQVELFGSDQLFRQSRARVDDGRTTAAVSNRQRTPSSNQGALVTWTTRAGRHAIVVGADGRRVTGTSTDALAPATVEADTLVERSAGGEQRFAGVFAEDLVQLTAAVELSAALRVDGWQDRGGVRASRFGDGERITMALDDRDELQLDPRLGVLVRASDVVALRASGYRAFRAPTLNELHRSFQVGTVLTDANPDLRPETLWGAELGAQVVTDELVVRATGFWNQLDDAVANVTLAAPSPSGATRQRQNLGQARIAGLELDLSWRPRPAWLATVAHTFIDAEVTAAPARPELVGKRLPQNPRRRATATLSFDDPRLLTATAQIRYLGQQFEDDLETLSIGAVVLVDARVARALGHGLSVFASVQNLLDRRYLVGRAGVDTEGAPRTFELGLSYDAGR